MLNIGNLLRHNDTSRNITNAIKEIEEEQKRVLNKIDQTQTEMPSLIGDDQAWKSAKSSIRDLEDRADQLVLARTQLKKEQVAILRKEKITHAENLKKQAFEAATLQAKELEKKYFKLCEGLIALGIANDICDELAKKAAIACQNAGIPFEDYQPPEQIVSTGTHWARLLKSMTLPDIRNCSNLWPQPTNESTQRMAADIRTKIIQDFKKRGFIFVSENP